MMNNRVLLVPRPHSAVAAGGTVCLPTRFSITCNGLQSWCTEAYAVRFGYIDPAGPCFITISSDLTLKPEEYILSVNQNEVKIRAGSENGAIQALTTLYSLTEDGQIPACEISDAPLYNHRGLSLDCARHFFPIETVKKIIEGMALCKMNVLHWHLSDDQGWRIESRLFPKLQEMSGQFYTQNEIRETVAYARLRGIEIVPEIDLPGHTSAILAAYPEFSCTGETVKLQDHGGIYRVILCAGREDVFNFLQSLLGEVCGLFPGARFHIGGDEAPKNHWCACPNCQKRMQAEGLATPEELQLWFTRRVAGILKEYGKTPICWNETLRAGDAPENAQIQYWTLQYRNSMETYAKQDRSWIYSDMFELYLDYPYSMTSLKKVYSTVPHLGKQTVTDGLAGIEACIWSEHITNPERLIELLFPRICALAEVCWSGAGKYSDFESRLNRTCTLLNLAGVAVMSPRGWNPEGRVRRKEAVAFFTTINAGLGENRAETVESAKPSREFGQAFMTKFFKPLDIPFLLKAMLK